VGSANQPLPRVIKKPVRLVVHFHRDVDAAVQVSMNMPVVTNGKTAL
jgi:hypothetical protein